MKKSVMHKKNKSKANIKSKLLFWAVENNFLKLGLSILFNEIQFIIKNVDNNIFTIIIK